MGIEVEGAKKWEEGVAFLNSAYEDAKTYINDGPPDMRGMKGVLQLYILLSVAIRGPELSMDLKELRVRSPSFSLTQTMLISLLTVSLDSGRLEKTQKCLRVLHIHWPSVRQDRDAARTRNDHHSLLHGPRRMGPHYFCVGPRVPDHPLSWACTGLYVTGRARFG